MNDERLPLWFIPLLIAVTLAGVVIILTHNLMDWIRHEFNRT